jgi:CRISPR-associated endonuclease/helicase Cas3
VTVPPRIFTELRSTGAVQPVNEKRFGEQFWELVNLELYRQDIGLMSGDPAFRSAESNIF